MEMNTVWEKILGKCFPFSCVEKLSSVSLVGFREQVLLVHPLGSPCRGVGRCLAMLCSAPAWPAAAAQALLPCSHSSPGRECKQTNQILID